ncbi:MAG: MOSC domain-containing protein [Pyrinomonadaceae bacterium]
MIVSEINVFPVKSLGGVMLESCKVEDRGLQNDRRLMLVDEKGDFLTQREYPKMATINCELLGDKIIVSSEGTGKISIPMQFESAKTVRVRVWQSVCEAIEADREINDWFSDQLETICRLVRMPEETKRQINPTFNMGNEIVSFADGYPLLLIGESSLSDLNLKLENKIPMNRFRPNIVVSGSEAFAEDDWKKIRIGKTVFRITKPCARCVITTIDQTTGIPDIKEPLKTLAGFRRASMIYPNKFSEFGLNKNDVLFGQNLVSENFGSEIKLGDKVELI